MYVYKKKRTVSEARPLFVRIIASDSKVVRSILNNGVAVAARAFVLSWFYYLYWILVGSILCGKSVCCVEFYGNFLCSISVFFLNIFSDFYI